MNIEFTMKTLRDTLTFSYPIYSDYKKVLPYTDLPYNFDQKKKPWWRWYFYASGLYYSRIHVNYSLWYNNHFKKKIGVYMPIVFKMPHKREKRYKPWIKKYYIYENSYTKKIKNWINPRNIFKLSYNFFNYNYFKSNVITNYAHWKYHNVLRSYKSSFYVGSENEMFISGYNCKWNNLQLRDSLYHEFLTNFNYTVPVNYFSMYGSFFINSYDSSIVLHPHSFFNYYVKKNNNRVYFIKKVFEGYYNKLDNCKLYYNIINFYNKIFKNLFINKLNYFNKQINLNIINIYKFNLLNLSKFKTKKLINILNLLINKFLNILLKVNQNNKINFKENIKINNKLKNFTYIYKIINKKYLSLEKNIKNKEFLLLNNFIKSKVYKKLKFLYYKNSYNIKNFNFLYYKKKISKNFIKFINIIKYKKLKIYKKYIKNLNKYIKNLNNNIKYKKFFIIRKENNLNKLKIRRFNIYPKIFVRMKDEYRYLYDKATVVINQSNNYSFFTWSKYSEDYMEEVKNFLYNFFLILIDLYKMNFGLFYNLNVFNKENRENIDLGFFIEIQIYIFRFLNLFKKKYFKKFMSQYLNSNSFKYNNFLGKIIVFKKFINK